MLRNPVDEAGCGVRRLRFLRVDASPNGAFCPHGNVLALLGEIRCQAAGSFDFLFTVFDGQDKVHDVFGPVHYRFQFTHFHRDAFHCDPDVGVALASYASLRVEKRIVFALCFVHVFPFPCFCMTVLWRLLLKEAENERATITNR